MSEKLIGTAKFQKIRNDLLWTLMKYELLDDGNSRWLDLKWTGYNDDAWWTKWSKEQDTVCKDDRVFRIDFETCDVYEVFDGRAL